MKAISPQLIWLTHGKNLETKEFYTKLVGMQINITSMENIIEVPENLKIELKHYSIILILLISEGNEEMPSCPCY
jgi:hypothetical protein